jgi:probable aminopeptidase NPEPL1
VDFRTEFHRKEFASAVADMKNLMSVRTNAGSSCAAQFIGSHMLGFQETGLWCHIDMAYPVHEGERATGWGASLMYDICHKL